MKNISRRELVRRTLGLGVTAGFLATKSAVAITDACLTTPKQTEGPFYPEKDQKDKDNDLTFVNGKPGQAKGQIVYIKGQVLDEKCVPVGNALVEIWQACASGRYNHSGDTNPAPLDPNFQYWGRAVTNAKGEYDFKTILPGSYPASPTWRRPPHIHYKVHALGFRDLTTQLYFAGDPLNEKDAILLALRPQERAQVTIELTDAGLEPLSKLGRFDLTIRRV